MTSSAAESTPSAAGFFPSTHWSVVLAARNRAEPQAETALAALCDLYWYPLYVFIRHRVGSAERVEELTQEFFAQLLQRDFLANVEYGKGRFRSFLLACCKNFLANQFDREHAKKRGGDWKRLSLDFESADRRYRLEPTATLTPEKLFDRQWALTLLDHVLGTLDKEYRGNGKGELFDLLKVSLLGESDALPYGEIAGRLNMSEAAVKKAAQALRQRYRRALRESLGATVDGPDEVDDELRQLFAILSS